MLPQFGFIVAQAGADYYSPPPPPVHSSVSTQPNNHSLAPLLNNTLRTGSSSSSHDYYKYNSPPPPSPFYSRQPSPSSQPLLPPPSFLPNMIKYQPVLPSLMDQHKKKDWFEKPKKYEQEPLDTRQDYHDLMTCLDNEFWEQADEIYQEKLMNLQNELVLLQKEGVELGTHSVFKELIADYELQREKSIQQAECFMKYQISFIEQYFDQDLSALEDEYENERKHLQDTLMTSIEDKRKQIKEDENEDGDHKNKTKRTLRKRAPDNNNSLRNEPLSKRRLVRPSTLYNIHTISPLEDEELENEFLYMKKLAIAPATTTTTTTNKLFSR